MDKQSTSFLALHLPYKIIAVLNPNMATPAKGKKRSSEELEITASVARKVQTAMNRNTNKVDRTFQVENLNLPFSMVLLP